MSDGGIVVGIDVATAALRVIALDTDDGSVVAAAETDLPPVLGSAGERTQAPTYGPVAVAMLVEIVAKLGTSAKRIRAISTTGTSGTIVPADMHGNPVGPAIMYNDARGQSELQRLHGAGFTTRTYTSLARIAWMQRRYPGGLFLSTPDIVNAHLARRALPTDTSHTLKAGINPAHRAWPVAEIACLGIDPSAFPVLVAPGVPIGEVGPARARELGLPADVAVISGMSDGCTSQIATGGVVTGDSVGVIGTTLVLKAVASHEIVDSRRGIYSHLAPDGAFWAGGASNAGAVILETKAPELSDLTATDVLSWQHGPSSAVCYPLPRVGERFPFDAPAMRSFAVPVDGAHRLSPSPIDLFRSAQEGLAFIERLSLECVVELGFNPSGRHLVSGGGSASRTWNAIRATTLGRPVHLPKHRTSAFGAAVLAASAALAIPLGEAVQRFCVGSDAVYPVEAWSAALEERYQLFRATLQALIGYAPQGGPPIRPR